MIKLQHLVREADIDPNHNIEGGTRSIELQRPQAKAVLERKCNSAWERRRNGFTIYRGLGRHGPHPFRLVQPHKSYRMARNTDNFVNAILDVIPSWKNWPKRTRSIICSSTPAVAGWYGKTFEVFPFDGAKIGICNSSDFWESFKYMAKRLHQHSPEHHFESDISVSSFNNMFQSVMSRVGYHADFWRFTEEDAKKLFQYLDKLEKRKPEVWDERLKIGEENGLYREERIFYKDFKENLKGDAEKYFSDLFDPVKNGFTLTTIEKYSVRDADRKEVWTDATSFMVAPEALHLIKEPKPHGFDVTNVDGTKEFWPIKGK